MDPKSERERDDDVNDDPGGKEKQRKKLHQLSQKSKTEFLKYFIISQNYYLLVFFKKIKLIY